MGLERVEGGGVMTLLLCWNVKIIYFYSIFV